MPTFSFREVGIPTPSESEVVGTSNKVFFARE
jgi:hypothetical protein